MPLARMSVTVVAVLCKQPFLLIGRRGAVLTFLFAVDVTRAGLGFLVNTVGAVSGSR